MGGGDLNLKKSWHPHTLKNQKRVYEAEQANAAERRKMQELQREIQNERNFEELKRIGQNSGVLAADEKNRLEWMYKGAENALNREEYLTGRAVDKHFEQHDKMERQKDTSSLVGVTVPKNHVEHECIPFSIRAFRGAPSSEEQVDLQRKIMEDPLMMIQQKEMETRQKLLQNPVKLKEIHRLLQQDKKLNESSSSTSHKKKKKSSKSKKSKKKRSHSDSDESDDLDSQLAKKYKKLLGAEKSESLSIDKLLNEKYAKLSSELDKIKTSKKSEKKSKKEKKKKRDSSHSSSDSSSTGKRNGKKSNSHSNAHDAHKRLMPRGREHESSRNWSNRNDDRRNRDISPHRNRDRDRFNRRSRSRSPIRSERRENHQRRNRSPHGYSNRNQNRRPRSRSPREQSRQSPPSDRYKSNRGYDSNKNHSNHRNRSKSRSVSPRRKPSHRRSRSKSRSPARRTNDSKLAHKSRPIKDFSQNASKSPEKLQPHHSKDNQKQESNARIIGAIAKPVPSPKKSSKSSSSGSSSSSSSSSSGSSSESNADSDNDRKKTTKNYGLVTAGGEKIDIDKNELAKNIPIVASKNTTTVIAPPLHLQPKKRLTDEEKEARLREMQQNAEWHDKELHTNRKRNEERARFDAEQEKTVEFDRNYIHKEMHKALNNQDSVEARLKSNKNNIQRLSSSMHSHFAKK